VNQSESPIKVINLDHLGIIAGIIDEMELVEEVNKIVGIKSNESLSPGQVMKAMILNGLGFLSAPLYLFEEFFVGKATEHLIGKGVLSSHLNDDKLGRSLDKYYQAGTTKIFTAIALKAVHKFQVKMNSVHLDGTSMYVHGEYKNDNQSSQEVEREKTEEESKMKPIEIGYGYSRDHRPELKQFIIDMIVTGDGDVPLYFKEIAEEEWESSGIKGYKIATRESEYGGVKQRWLIIESEARKSASIKQIEKGVEKQELKMKAALRKLSRQEFACQEDAETAIKMLSDAGKYHQVKEIKCEEKRLKKSTEKSAESPSKVYQITGEISRREEVIETAKMTAGRFILATNILDKDEMNDGQILEEYKEQQSDERGFRFLKDPLFFTSNVFVKNPERVEAIAMIMGVCLLVYNLAQRKLRQELALANGNIRNQVKKLTNKPTMRWIFQMFQAIHLVSINGEVQVSNLTKERQAILNYLGKVCGQYYLIDESG